MELFFFYDMDVVKEYFTTLDKTFWISLTISSFQKSSNKFAPQ